MFTDPAMLLQRHQRRVRQGPTIASLAVPTAVFAGVLVATLLARTSVAEPPRSILQPAGELAAAAAHRPLAGLTTSRASDVLREQLALPNGSGLIVENVVPGSAAERAGLRKHDILVALDEQLLVLPEQLPTLLSASDPDTPHRLDIRRAGAALPIHLGPPPRSAAPTTAPASLPPHGASPSALPQPPSAPAEPFVPPPGARRVGPDAVVLENRDCKLKVYRDADTFLTVRDARGWLVFNGPISTPEQRSLIPRRVRDRVERLEAMLDAVVVEASPSTAGAPADATPPAAEASAGPVTEIGLLDVPPIEVR